MTGARPRGRRTTTGAAVGVLLIAASAGCGQSDADAFAAQSPASIVKAADDAMRAVQQVRVQGDLASGAATIRIDLRVSTTGDCTGTYEGGGGTADVVHTRDTTWFRPDDDYWKASLPKRATEVIAAQDGKWVSLPSGQDSFAQVCDLDALLDQVLGDSGGTPTYAAKGTTTIEDTDVIRIERTSAGGKRSEPETSTGYVALSAPHYLYELEQTDGQTPSTLRFSDFDQDFEVTAPAADDQIGYADLPVG